MSWRRVLAAWAGPVSIVALVLFALRGFAFAHMLTDEHPDLLAFWLPRWSFLGRSIADGVIPVWNPYEMLGYRFAADPQSGWLAAIPSLLFSTLSPGVAMRAVVVAQPMLAGLGLYGFLRVDGSARVAATAGGLALAGAMSASEVVVAMPFAGVLGWTTICLLAAAGYVRSDRWSRRLAWLVLGGFAWSQVASAHLSHGLVAATLVLGAYLVARTTPDGWIRTVGFLAALPLLALPVLLPRFQFISTSSLAAGYDAVGGAATVLPAETAPISAEGVWAAWPLAFGATPGAYLGAAALVAAPMAIRAARRRRVAVALTVVLGVTWVFLLPGVLGTAWVRDLVLGLPFGDVALHNPGRFRYVALMTLPVLAALGIDGLVREPPSIRSAAVWTAAGALAWVGIPLLMGGDPTRWRLLAVALIPAGALVIVSARRARWAPAIAAVLTIELAIGATMAGRHSGDEIILGLEEPSRAPLAFQPLRAADVDLDAYVSPTAFVPLIGDDRYLTWAPPAAAYEKGYLFAQAPSDWPALANGRGTLFGIRDALGYNPVQLPAYWGWIRERNPLPVYYNAAVLARPSALELATMGVRYLVVPQGVAPPAPGTVVVTAEGYDLVEIAPPPGPGRSSANIERTGPAEIRIEVPTLGLPVVVDEAYDPGWTARTDDGRVADVASHGPVMRVTLPEDARTATLTYADPWVTRSAAAGVMVWGALGVAIGVCAVRERRTLRPTPGGEARPR